MPLGRVRVENGSVRTAGGALLRGGVAEVFKYGVDSRKALYSRDADYYRNLANGGLNAVRIVCSDPWQRTYGYTHWDLNLAAHQKAFLAELDRSVALAEASGLYALIDYHDVGNCDFAFLELFWTLVAPRYAHRPHVFYELANEPVAWCPENYTDDFLRKLEQVYQLVRRLAPETHISLLSFANVARKTPPVGSPMRDVVERMVGIDWSNASVAVHPYGQLRSDVLTSLASDFPLIVTEIDLPVHAGGDPQPFLYTSLDGCEYAIEALERANISWFCWNIAGPEKFDRNFIRGVCRDAAAKGYLWPVSSRPKPLIAGSSVIAPFLGSWPMTEMVHRMGLRPGHVAICAALLASIVVLDSAMLFLVLAASQGTTASAGMAPTIAAIVFAGGMKHALRHVLERLTTGWSGRYLARLAESIASRFQMFGKSYFDLNKPSAMTEAIEGSHEFVKLLHSLLSLFAHLSLVLLNWLVLLVVAWPAAIAVILFGPLCALPGKWPAGQKALRHPLCPFLLDLVTISVLAGLFLGDWAMAPSGAWGATVLAATFLLRVMIPLRVDMLRGRLELLRQLPKLDPLFDVFNDNGKYILPPGNRPYEGLTESIRFQELTFSYPEREPVLHNVSFIIKKRQRTALVGPPGSGKSTLIALLLRHYDVPPFKLVIDGINIRDYEIASLRRNIAEVSQPAGLLQDTFRANLLVGVEESVGEEELERVIQDACLEGILQRLPYGIETRLTSVGHVLSEAECWCVAIARAMLKNAEIVLLDEADSCPDPKLQIAIRNLLRDRTALVITHRLETIEQADRVVVLKQGCVVEQGKPQELLAQRGHFHELCQSLRFQ